MPRSALASNARASPACSCACFNARTRPAAVGKFGAGIGRGAPGKGKRKTADIGLAIVGRMEALRLNRCAGRDRRAPRAAQRGQRGEGGRRYPTGQAIPLLLSAFAVGAFRITPQVSL
jgi:hypothetical protein